jgi:alpha-mannosidase
MGTVGLEITCRLDWPLPEGLTADRHSRSPKKQSLPLKTTARLYAGIDRVEFETRVDNRILDHRLRVLFPTGLFAETLEVARHFETAILPVHPPAPDKRDRQPAVPTRYVGEFIRVRDRQSGVALMNRGLPEFESRHGVS